VDPWRSALRIDPIPALRAADGAALVERLLRQGEKVTLRGRRIWLELGAAGNVDVLVNGRDRPIPSGTTNVVLG
jgi:hypothetical protein